MKPDLVITGGTIITMNKDRKIINTGVLYIHDGKIVKIDENVASDKQYLCQHIDASGKFIFPGLINTHTHIFQTLIRGLGEDLPVWKWFEKVIDPIVENLTEHDAYVSSKLGSMEAIKSGTTTILEYNYPNPYPGMAIETIRAFQEVGIRGILARGIIDTGNVHKKIIHSTREELDACEDLLKKFGNIPDRMINVWIAPYTIFSTTKEAFIQSKLLADQYDSRITVHAATPSTIEASMDLYGMDDISFEESIGFLSPRVLAVHCCAEMPDSVLNIMRDHGVKVSHNPVSNAYLGEGITPIKKMVQKGIKVSLATDGPASNNNQDMVAVMKFCSLLQRVANLDTTAMTALKTLEMATCEGAECVGMDSLIGSLEIGKQADLFIADFNMPNTMAFSDPVSCLVYSATQENIRTVIVNGKIVLENRRIINVDEEESLAAAYECSQKLINRAFY